MITLQGLRKSYGDVLAVDGVDLTVAPGEAVALLGPNGAGKSTTVDMLLGLSTPDAGSVTVFGRTPAAATAAGSVGAMLQSGGLLSELTVGELVDLVRSLYPKPLRRDEILERAFITDLAKRRTEKLSGGQQQRVRFALALAGDPDLLVLDEPTVGMDVESRRAFWAAMREYTATGRTVIFATHYLEEADAYSDRIVLLAKGRVVADGSTTALKATVAGRTIRATLPGADAEALRRLPGVGSVEVHGDAVLLRCTSSDDALRALLAGQPTARDVEVRGADLEDAFLALTDSHRTGSGTTHTEEGATS